MSTGQQQQPSQRQQQPRRRDPLAPRKSWSPTQRLAWSALVLAVGADDATVTLRTALDRLATVLVFLRGVTGLAGVLDAASRADHARHHNPTVPGAYASAQERSKAVETVMACATSNVVYVTCAGGCHAFHAFLTLHFGCDGWRVEDALDDDPGDVLVAAPRALSMALRLRKMLRTFLPTAEGINARSALDAARGARERGEVLTLAALYGMAGMSTVAMLAQDLARTTVDLNRAVDDPTTTYTVEDRDTVLRCLQQPAPRGRHTVTSHPTAVSP